MSGTPKTKKASTENRTHGTIVSLFN
jgi:hypothetical protein